MRFGSVDELRLYARDVGGGSIVGLHVDFDPAMIGLSEHRNFGLVPAYDYEVVLEIVMKKASKYEAGRPLSDWGRPEIRAAASSFLHQQLTEGSWSVEGGPVFIHRIEGRVSL